MPAAAVTPAPIAYTVVVAVKTFVVEILLRFGNHGSWAVRWQRLVLGEFRLFVRDLNSPKV